MAVELDHWGYALRLVKRIRAGEDIADVVGSVEEYARDVRDTQCAPWAAFHVGRSADRIRKNCDVPVAVIARWAEDAVRDFGPGRKFTDRKLTHFLSAMYKEVQAAQVADAVREAGAQAAKARARGDRKKAASWRKVEANLDAMRRSIADGGFVPIPYPPE